MASSGKMSTSTSSDKKTEVGELRSLLRNSEIQRDPKQYEQAVQKVIAYMTLGIDVSSLFSEMIMAGATQNMVQKKMVYLYLSTYAEQNSELSLLTVNTLRKDANDRNPTVRGLALRSMSSLRIPNIVEYIQQPLQAGLQDKSAYVRKTAVMGVVKLFYVAPEVINDLNLVDVLYQMLRDNDPYVICNCLSALEEILANEGGMVITKKIAHYLINRLRDFSEWGQCQILQLLLRYKCEDEEEVFDILSVIDDRLKHVVSAVVFATIRLFFHLTDGIPDLQDDINDRIKTPLLTAIGSSSPEVVYTCLQHIEILIFRNPNMFSEEYHNFFCRYNDPPYVKLKKLELLTHLCDDGNAQNVVEELSESATDVNTHVAQMAIQAIGKISVRIGSQANICVDTLLALLNMEIDHITSETVTTMTNVLRKYEEMHEMILPRLTNCYDIMSSPQGKSSLIWIIGEFGESLPDSPYLLEDIVNQVGEEPSSEVKLQLLSAVMKMFFKRPPECQEMLGRLLEFVIDEETDMIVRDRGLLYYRLLKADVKAAKNIVCGSQKLLSEYTSPPKAATLFSEFNSLAVMYSQSSSEFIEPSPPYTLLNDPQTTREDSYLDQLFMVQKVVDDTTDLLDMLGPSSSGNAVPHILLNPKPTMTAEEFEGKWSTLSTSREETIQLSSVARSKDIQHKLSKKFVSTLACSPENQPVMKMFLYAQHVSTFDYFLVEVTLTAADSKMKLVMKSDNPKLVHEFFLHVMETLRTYL